MLTNVFEEARERVTAQEAARFYGISIDRNGRALCPFHMDRHPSMSFRNGRFRCWSCGAAGDSIDFVRMLFNCDAICAVQRLDNDFSLALQLHGELSQAEKDKAARRKEIMKAHNAFEEWRREFICRLNTAIRAGNTYDPSKPNTVALRLKSTLEYYADLLSYGTPQDQADVYKLRRSIELWIEAVLKN